MIIRLDAEAIERVFKIPSETIYIEISKQSAAEYFAKREKDCKRHINKWIHEPRTALTRWANLYRSDFKNEIGDTITLLSRMMGLEHSNVFEPWMYQFIMLVRQSQHICWGEIISDALCEQLAVVPTTFTFYMNSYLVYIAASLRHFPGLSTKGDRMLVPVWEYYDQLPLRSSRSHFRRVRDAFFGHYLCQFDKNLKNKRVSDEAWEKVKEYGCLFLQFPTFTYMRVGCYGRQPYMLPWYPTYKIILMELGRQIMVVHTHQSVKHKVGMGISSNNPLKIGQYSLMTSIKARAMETELQEIRLKRFKPRVDFDYRGMKEKIKKTFIHVHRIEDIWADLRTEKEIRKMDYCRLTAEQIVDLNLMNMPQGMIDDGNVLDPEFVNQNVDEAPLPSIH